ncbi:2-amino-4-hydroxy-6-hydroxymethyldihydropteridine diphosphokinase [Octadecabacter sp. 1_MG-2023]|uniref:2-amino-4-hydroxy-6- hydroxymethyldihydropteridine diphosphokinase n=1 Tax=unclassified Octadecabacter TaxID=196158 RepID=UPI0020900A44|nr:MULTISPECIES: 2-amino-4-hydroxy-6-hydroxymethyldihydropteridine diphosphokinase [unclassified Octadecabacter]MDO6734641.1 2-amino-4-hydroxy-6-hydroxymethyldihydropteridine diphosphokinase [Octadecabacter sp. 1_MG-2023]
MKSRIVLVALGSNVTSQAGGPSETVAAAIDALGDQFGETRVSKFYQTPAFPAGSGPDFVNAACAFYSDRPASEILAGLHSIEAAFGRDRQVRWGSRTLDLDLIACGDDVRPDHDTFRYWRDMPLSEQQTRAPEQLTLPHPRLQERAFVLVPLADVAPDWVHPVQNRTVSEMLSELGAAELSEITPLN